MARKYCPFYCEENIYHLCQESLAQSRYDAVQVLFISNASREVAVFQQQAGSPAEGLVVWDYHVVLLAAQGKEKLVCDFDTRLGWEVSLEKYVLHSFPQLTPEYAHLAPQFRLVDGDEFVRSFASDRSHMLDDAGRYWMPPPDWECIGEGTNLADFINFQSPFLGRVMDLDELLS